MGACQSDRRPHFCLTHPLPMNRTCSLLSIAVLFTVCTGAAWAGPLNPRPLKPSALREAQQMRGDRLYPKAFAPRQYAPAPNGYRAPRPKDPWTGR